MTPIEFPQIDASQHAAAIARWDDEGGASKSSPSDAGAKTARKRPTSRQRIRNKPKEASKATHRVNG